MAAGIGNLPCRALPDVSTRIDDEDLIRHVNLGEMHLVQHLLYPVLPDLIVSAVAEESDRYDNVSLKGQFLLNPFIGPSPKPGVKDCKCE